VRYKRLPRGTFARVQPVMSKFRREVEDVKSLLEIELMRYIITIPISFITTNAYHPHTGLDCCGGAAVAQSPGEP